MVITYYGLACLKVSFGDTVVAVNPIGKGHDVKSARFGADVALISVPTEGFNGQEAVAFGSKEPFVIDGPGEYEYSGIFIKGYESVGPQDQVNTIYSFLLEGIRVVHLGALAVATLPPDVLEEISGADIVVAPAGAEGSLPAKAAAKLAASLESKIIIPVLFGDSKSGLLSEFLAEAGAAARTPIDKLSVKKKDLEGQEAEIVVLQTT
ncbi:MAG: hypothetical protein A2589_02570 [Candidatus Vogelbacteria bacterium RIFOXYD1_FULL_46_19]|jgi:hypothetical protein|uniref:Lactamase n=1 Tax=Candidatus Vogelbacteria bacterium RIFOXYD1_FULL_46_19 TaxID=1802439 RepID=A0A1G2QIW0_9BACT|nr:MAG: hypothetical protein A2589_02570 [Candidatus Vogelbacteria bacterium RIFOXYD1_FULL_46_19]